MNFTKKELQRSFWSLQEERPFDKITVKNVIACCGVNRNTFYYHFRNMRDLMRASVQSWLEDLDCSAPEALLDGLQKHRAALLNIYRSLPRDEFIGELNLWMRSLLYRRGRVRSAPFATIRKCCFLCVSGACAASFWSGWKRGSRRRRARGFCGAARC